MAYSPGGFIGGVLAGEASVQEAQKTEADLAKKAFELRKSKYDFAKELDIESAVEAAGPELAQLANPSERAIRLSEIVAAQGEPTKAVEFLAKAAQMQSDEAGAAEKGIKASIESANAAAVILEQVQDGPSLEAVFERTQVQGIDTKGVIPGLYQHYKTKGWDADLERALKMARISIVNKKDQAAIQLDKIRGDTERARQEEIRATTKLRQAQTEQELEQTRQIRKTGGIKTQGDKVNASYAANLIATTYDVEEEKALAGMLSEELASTANDILRQNPGITREQAMQRAMHSMKQDGKFAGLDKLEGPKGSLKNPKPLPIGKDNKIDPTALVVGDIYGGMGTYYGKPVKWTGTEFVEVPLGGSN